MTELFSSFIIYSSVKMLNEKNVFRWSIYRGFSLNLSGAIPELSKCYRAFCPNVQLKENRWLMVVQSVNLMKQLPSILARFHETNFY